MIFWNNPYRRRRKTKEDHNTVFRLLLNNQIRAIKKFYEGYKRGIFVGTMLSLFNNDNFDYNRFMHKLEIQPGVLHDCASRAQYKLLIEDIYNYKSREKVNLRY